MVNMDCLLDRWHKDYLLPTFGSERSNRDLLLKVIRETNLYTDDFARQFILYTGVNAKYDKPRYHISPVRKAIEARTDGICKGLPEFIEKKIEEKENLQKITLKFVDSIVSSLLRLQSKSDYAHFFYKKLIENMFGCEVYSNEFIKEFLTISLKLDLVFQKYMMNCSKKVSTKTLLYMEKRGFVHTPRFLDPISPLDHFLNSINITEGVDSRSKIIEERHIKWLVSRYHFISLACRRAYFLNGIEIAQFIKNRNEPEARVKEFLCNFSLEERKEISNLPFVEEAIKERSGKEACITIDDFLKSSEDVREQKAKEPEELVDGIATYLDRFGKARHITCQGLIQNIFSNKKYTNLFIQQIIERTSCFNEFLNIPSCSIRITDYIRDRLNKTTSVIQVAPTTTIRQFLEYIITAPRLPQSIESIEQDNHAITIYTTLLFNKSYASLDNTQRSAIKERLSKIKNGGEFGKKRSIKMNMKGISEIKWKGLRVYYRYMKNRPEERMQPGIVLLQVGNKNRQNKDIELLKNSLISFMETKTDERRLFNFDG